MQRQLETEVEDDGSDVFSEISSFLSEKERLKEVYSKDPVIKMKRRNRNNGQRKGRF